MFDISADLQDCDTCDSRSRLKVAAVISRWEITNLSMRMRLDTSRPKCHYKNPGALRDRVILSTCVWPFVYLRHITKDPSPNTNTEQNHERKFPTCSLKATLRVHTVQLTTPVSYGQKGRRASSSPRWGTAPSLTGLPGIGSIPHSLSLPCVFPLLEKFAKWKEDHGQCSARDENLISPRMLLTWRITGPKGTTRRI